MLEGLKHIDHQLFNFVNHDLGNPFFDAILPFFRIMWLWLPLYIFLFWLLYKKYGAKDTLFIIIGWGITIALSDALLANGFKHFFERVRPCHYADIEGIAPIIRDQCGSGFSFTSAHATNHFAIAVYFLMFFQSRHRYWLLLWAASIAFASVYIAVHYPADVLVGAISGGLVGFWTGRTAVHIL